MSAFNGNAFFRLSFGVLCLAPMIISGLARGQGSLTPPGAPAPSMRTLNQVEPRTPLNAVTGESGVCQVLISKPGSYYLTGNINGVANLDCIKITTHGVTLDLNGFALVGKPESRVGILAPGSKWIQIRNGSIRNWGSYGIMLGNYSRLENLMICENGGTGLAAGFSCMITNCIATDNEGSGISTNGGSIIRECIAEKNDMAGINVMGNGGQVLNCVANGNNSGISAAIGASWKIAGNALSGNLGNTSIMLGSQNMVLNNLLGGNIDHNAIVSSGGMNRIEGNHVTRHDVGYRLDPIAGKDVAVNNSAIASTGSNYTNTGGLNGTSVAPRGTTAAAINPYANIDIP